MRCDPLRAGSLSSNLRWVVLLPLTKQERLRREDVQRAPGIMPAVPLTFVVDVSPRLNAWRAGDHAAALRALAASAFALPPQPTAQVLFNLPAIPAANVGSIWYSMLPGGDIACRCMARGRAGCMVNCPNRRAFLRAALRRNGYRTVSMNSRIRIGQETTLSLWNSMVLDRKDPIAHGDRRGPTETAGAGGCSWHGAAVFWRNGDRNGASCRIAPEIPAVSGPRQSLSRSALGRKVRIRCAGPGYAAVTEADGRASGRLAQPGGLVWPAVPGLGASASADRPTAAG
jgi:hypothetical protein